MTTQKFDVSLRLRHTSDDLRPFATLLGRKPNHCWVRGDKTDDGKRTRDESYCNIQLMSLATIDDLEYAISGALTEISKAAEELERLSLSGGTAVIAIGWFTGGDSGESLSMNLVAELARLHLGIDIYLYVDPALTNR